MSINAKDKERIEWIKDLVEYVFPEILGEEVKKILKIIEKKEKENMQDLVKRIKSYEERREKRLRGEGRKEAIKETITQMIKNMLELNQDEELIMKCTKAKKEEIEKIKKEIKLQIN